MLTIENRGLIFDSSQQSRQHRIAFFTSLCCLRSGAILCGFQLGPKKHAVDSIIGLCRSEDQGLSWHRLPAEFPTTIDGVPGSLGAAELVEAFPGRLLLFATWFDRSEPDRPLFDPVTQGILKSKQLLSISTDEGQTWSEWRQLPTPGLTGCAMTGPVTQWADGQIAFAFESFKEFDDPQPGHHAAWLMVSDDHGETFDSPVLVARHPAHRIYYWDQRLCAGTEPGELTALFWTHDLAQQCDLTVHLRHTTLQSLRSAADGDTHGDSSAGGRSDIRDTGISGQIAAPARLRDGRLLAFVVDRSQPCTMSLWCSSDDGRTWPIAQRLVVYTHDEQAQTTQGQQNIDFRQYWEDMGKWSFGHPAIRLLQDDRVLLAWYAGTPDCMSIHWARVHIGRSNG